MTTTRIYFDPYASAAQANGYSRYDLEGTVKDTRLNETFIGRANATITGGGTVEKGNHRIDNNTYDWIVVLTQNFAENNHKIILDATNWPLDGNTGVTISDVGVATFADDSYFAPAEVYFAEGYTTPDYVAPQPYVASGYVLDNATQSYIFPGGGTISSTNYGIAVRGRYLVNRAYNFGDNILVEYGLKTHQGNVATVLARSVDVSLAAAPGYGFITTSEEAVYQYSPYATYYITPATNTLANVKFFAHAEHQVRTIGATGAGRETSLDFFYEYEWRSVWEVNLHSANSAIAFTSTIAIEPTIARFGQSNLAVTSELAGSSQLTIASAQIQNTITSTLTAQVGFTQSAVCATAGSSTAQFSAGRVYAGAAAAQIDAELSANGNRTPGGTASASADTDSTATATNTIGVSDGRGYVTIDYAESDYFPEGQGLQFQQATSILADANIIASDGSITFDAAFDAVIRPGFRIDGSVTAAGAGDFTIAPYITGGVGLLFAAAANLSAEAAVVQATFGLLIESAAVLQQQATTAVLAGNQISSNYQFAPVTTALAVDAESRPSIKAAITIGDDGRLTAEAFVDNSSTAVLDTGPFVLGPAQAGYLLSADVEIIQEINSQFGETETRIFYVDMYYTTVIAAETRQYHTGPEARLFQPDPETRVNTNLVETRQVLVDPETRQAEIAILPTTLRNSKLFRIPA